MTLACFAMYTTIYVFDRFIIVCMCIFTLLLYSRKSKIKYSGIELVSNVFAHLFTHFFPLECNRIIHTNIYIYIYKISKLTKGW